MEKEYLILDENELYELFHVSNLRMVHLDNNDYWVKEVLSEDEVRSILDKSNKCIALKLNLNSIFIKNRIAQNETNQSVYLYNPPLLTHHENIFKKGQEIVDSYLPLMVDDDIIVSGLANEEMYNRIEKDNKEIISKYNIKKL